MFTFASARQRCAAVEKSITLKKEINELDIQKYNEKAGKLIVRMESEPYWFQKVDNFDVLNGFLYEVRSKVRLANIMDLTRLMADLCGTALEQVKVEKSQENMEVFKMALFSLAKLQDHIAQALGQMHLYGKQSDVRLFELYGTAADTLFATLAQCTEIGEVDTSQNENEKLAQHLIDCGLYFSRVGAETVAHTEPRRKMNIVLHKVVALAVEHVKHVHDIFSRSSVYLSSSLAKNCADSTPAASFACDLLESYEECQLSNMLVRGILSQDPFVETLNRDLQDSIVKVLDTCAQSGALYPCLVNNWEPFLNTLSYLVVQVRQAAIRACRHLFLHLAKIQPLPVDRLDALLDAICDETHDVSFSCRRESLKSLSVVYEVAFNLGPNHVQVIGWQDKIIEFTCDRIKDKVCSVRSLAMEIFAGFMACNRFIIDPMAVQEIAHLDSSSFKAQAESAKEEMDAAKQLLDSTASADQRITALTEQIFAIKSEIDAGDEDGNVPVDSHTQGLISEKEELERDVGARKNLYDMASAIHNWLESAVMFAETCDEVIEWTKKLIFSPMEKDKIALIRLYKCADLLHVKGARERRASLLHMAWTATAKLTGENSGKYSPVIIKLVGMYKMFWLDGVSVEVCALGLVDVAGRAREAERHSLKKLLMLLIKDDELNRLVDDDYLDPPRDAPPRPSWAAVVNCVWRLFSEANQDPIDARDNILQSNCALLLSMLTSINPEFAVEKTHLIWGLKQPKSGARKKSNYATYTHIFKALCNSAGALGEEEKRNCRRQLCSLLLCSTNTLEWFAFAHEAVHALTRLGEIHTLTSIFRLYCKRLYPKDVDNAQDTNSDDEDGADSPENNNNNNNMPPEKRQIYYAQMLYLAGEAIQEVQAELDLVEERYKLALTQASAERAHANADDGEDFVQQRQMAEFQFANQLEAVRKQDLLRSKLSIFEMFQDKIQGACAEIVTVETNRHGRTDVDERSVFSPFVQVACVSALCKFMTASNDYCQLNLPMLMAILNTCTSASLRSTIMVAIGDNAAQNGYATDRYIPKIFDQLSLPDKTLKRTTTAVLTFLILGGKVKIRGNLGYMAPLLVDRDPKIKLLARTFFSEFGTKDKDFFNAFMDIYSTVMALLSPQQEPDVSYKKVTVKLEDCKEMFTFLCDLFKSRSDRIATLLKLQEKQWDIQTQETLDYFKHVVKRICTITAPASDEGGSEGAGAPTPAPAAAATEEQDGARRPAKKAKKAANSLLLDDPKLERLKKFLELKTFTDLEKQRNQDKLDEELQGEEDFDRTHQVDTTMDNGVRRRSSRHHGGGVGTSRVYDESAALEHNSDLENVGEVEEQATNSPGSPDYKP